MRTPIKVKLGFKNFYLYSAVSPLSGDSCTLLLPCVNVEAMNSFLAEMEKSYPHEEILLIMDGASWHKSKDLRVPHNIQILCLPPYSPELNPIERLWQHVKYHTIRNKLFDSIQSLEDDVCQFLNTLKPQDFISICSCTYLYS